MRVSRKLLVIPAIIFSLALSFIAPAKAANLDDVYPEGAEAPGRTCPNSPAGFEPLSEYSQKTLVSTVIIGEKKS